ncbi:MAG: hypothetical protein U0P45_13370 [Acidimicrobiales bacterium]
MAPEDGGSHGSPFPTAPPLPAPARRPWWRRWWAWALLLPLALVLGGCATLVTVVSVSARRSADRDLARMEATGTPDHLRKLGTVVEDQHLRGAVLEGDPTRIVIVVEARGTAAELRRDLQRSLEADGFRAFDPDGRFQYFSRDDARPHLTATTEVVGPGGDLRGDGSDRRAPPGTAAAVIELS